MMHSHCTECTQLDINSVLIFCRSKKLKNKEVWHMRVRIFILSKLLLYGLSW